MTLAVGGALAQAGATIQDVADRWRRQHEELDTFKMNVARERLDLELSGDLQAAATRW